MSGTRSRRIARRFPVLVVLAALVLGGCTAPAPGPTASGAVTVSYDGAVARLAAIGPAEAGQQVQDWARLGLASALGMTSGQLLDQTYDGTVLRDEALDGLADQPVTTGRSLFDGRTGILHLLVPSDDSLPQRTVAALLDEYRAATGADAPRTQVHPAVVDGPGRQVRIEAGDPEPTADVRTGNGWIERRIDDPASLAGFLSVADQLTRVELRGGETWAEGWDFPGVAAPVTQADVAVLARGYGDRDGPRPGFSLDPVRDPSPADVAAGLAGLPSGVVRALTTGDYTGSGFTSPDDLGEVVQRVLFDGAPPSGGLPADRTLLWAVYERLADAPVYSQARYDGGIAGTEVGKTLFYTDYVAKNWKVGTGSGSPYGVVPGFVPDARSQTPPGLCPDVDGSTGESGRLWFGQNDAAFAYGPDGVSIGRQATRLYSRANGPAGSEVEPDYQFGRALRWWDRNAQAVADYDPQYRRLEQLMRWSGALEWLSLSNRPLGAGPAPAPGGSFQSWYTTHTDLRERAPLSLVRPPSAQTEAVRMPPTTTFPDCGVPEIEGGVSLSDLSERGGIPDAAPLPPDLARPRAADRAGTAVDATGDGTITRRPEQESGTGGAATVYTLRHDGPVATGTVAGPPSIAVRAGDARLVTDGGRGYQQVFRSDGPDYDVDLRIAGMDSGRVDVRNTGDVVSIGYLPGVRELFGRAAEQLRVAPGTRTGGLFRYAYDVPGGVIRLADDGTTSAWIATGDPSGFQVSATAEVRRPDGGLERIEVGTPRVLEGPALAALGPPSPPIHTTAGALSGSLGPGTQVYVTDPAALAAGQIPPSLPVVVVVRSKRGPPVPGPGRGAVSDSRFAAAGGPAPGGGAPGGAGAPPRLLPPPYMAVLVTTACPDDQRNLRPEDRQECAQ